MKYLEEKNQTRSMMKTDYGDEKLDKSDELNETMSIKHSEPDKYTKQIKNIGGRE